MENPKVFISYSWSSPEHQDWVLRLATDLMNSGVVAIIDKWDLREGQEATKFMEMMVTDQSIKKVIIVADRVYSEKANQRTGGAGTEAQIISAELFRGSDSNRFAALVVERDENGNPFVPAFYTSRIFIDFTENSRHTDNFEQLLRWIFDKPLHRKPQLGPVPHYIFADNEAKTMRTSVVLRRATDAIIQGKTTALASAQDYFQTFVNEVKIFQISNDNNLLGEDIVQIMDDSQQYRNEVVSLIEAMLRYLADPKIPEVIHEFIEGLWNEAFPNQGVTSYREADYDVIYNLTWEIGLHIAAISYKTQRPDVFRTLVDVPYYLPRLMGERTKMEMFGNISRTNSLLEFRERNKERQYYVPEATLLKSRPSVANVDFELLMQADFLVYLRTSIAKSSFWVPKTLVYKNRWGNSFPAFMRAKSRNEFLKLAQFTGADKKEVIEAFVVAVENKEIWSPKWGFDGINTRALTDLENLATLP